MFLVYSKTSFGKEIFTLFFVKIESISVSCSPGFPSTFSIFPIGEDLVFPF